MSTRSNWKATTVIALLSCALLISGGHLQADEQQEARAAEAQRLEAEKQTAMAERQASLAEKQAALADAEAALHEAELAMQQSREAIARNRLQEEAEVAQAREELSRAHRQMREVSREIARAHRELARSEELQQRLRVLNLGDRPLIGVLLGEESTEGVVITGVSPDGPAEKAGIRQNDVLIALGGVELAGRSDGSARRALIEVMNSAEAGEQLAATLNRSGELLDVFVVPEQREPLSWQSLLRLPAPPSPPSPPGAPSAPDAPRVIVETIEIPDIDEEELSRRVAELTEQAQNFEYLFIGDDGQLVEFSQDFEFSGEPLSRFGGHALSEANVWFDSSAARGLELASINEGLGKYFKADSGVLVIQARDDNAYGLESGDVIQSVAGTPISSPADFLRAVRDAEPGSEIELSIKRDRKSRTLNATVPENRLGMHEFRSIHRAEAPHAVREYVQPD